MCPTGIDIRNGIQLDCIGCTACIDACDEMMDKVGRPRGLIRMDSERALEREPRRFWRPRIFIYIALLVLGVLVMSFTLHQQRDFEANLIRLQGQPWVIEDGVVRDSFELHIVNKRNEAATYRVEPVPEPNVTWTVPLASVRLESLAAVDAPVFVSMPATVAHGDHVLHVRVYREGSDPAAGKLVSVPFLAP